MANIFFSYKLYSGAKIFRISILVTLRCTQLSEILSSSVPTTWDLSEFIQIFVIHIFLVQLAIRMRNFENWRSQSASQNWTNYSSQRFLFIGVISKMLMMLWRSPFSICVSLLYYNRIGFFLLAPHNTMSSIAFQFFWHRSISPILFFGAAVPISPYPSQQRVVTWI